MPLSLLLTLSLVAAGSSSTGAGAMLVGSRWESMSYIMRVNNVRQGITSHCQSVDTQVRVCAVDVVVACHGKV